MTHIDKYTGLEKISFSFLDCVEWHSFCFSKLVRRSTFKATCGSENSLHCPFSRHIYPISSICSFLLNLLVRMKYSTETSGQSDLARGCPAPPSTLPSLTTTTPPHTRPVTCHAIISPLYVDTGKKNHPSHLTSAHLRMAETARIPPFSHISPLIRWQA